MKSCISIRHQKTYHDGGMIPRASGISDIVQDCEGTLRSLLRHYRSAWAMPCAWFPKAKVYRACGALSKSVYKSRVVSLVTVHAMR